MSHNLAVVRHTTLPVNGLKQVDRLKGHQRQTTFLAGMMGECLRTPEMSILSTPSASFTKKFTYIQDKTCTTSEIMLELGPVM